LEIELINSRHILEIIDEELAAKVQTPWMPKPISTIKVKRVKSDDDLEASSSSSGLYDNGQKGLSITCRGMFLA
jgi:hypothetical protein